MVSFPTGTPPPPTPSRKNDSPEPEEDWQTTWGRRWSIFSMNSIWFKSRIVSQDLFHLCRMMFPIEVLRGNLRHPFQYPTDLISCHFYVWRWRLYIYFPSFLLLLSSRRHFILSRILRKSSGAGSPTPASPSSEIMNHNFPDDYALSGKQIIFPIPSIIFFPF